MRAKVGCMAVSQMPDMSVKVAIVEDDAGTLQGWVKLLAGHPRVRCVAACASAEAAIEQIPDTRPEVVLMDINLPGMSGIQCTASLKQLLPKTQILMLTAYSDDDCVFDALQAGASGYLLKSISSAELIRSIVEVADGGAPMSGKIARRVIEVFRKPATKGPEESQLTSRENEILQLLAKGYANKEIGLRLECSTGTVSKHLEHIYEKLHVHCRSEATAKYLGAASLATQQTARRGL